ncbi:MAG: hypothetical protein ACPGVG_08940 [Mycobacterium sp.]
MTALDAHRRDADERARKLENRIFEATTRAWRREQAEPDPPPVLAYDMSDIDLTGDPDLDEDGRF